MPWEHLVDQETSKDDGGCGGGQIERSGPIQELVWRETLQEW